jgi:putative FmdB family regulatory protein
MPIYEYECPTHGKFERLRPIHVDSSKALCYDDGCMNDCEKVFSQFSTLSNSKSTVYFENPQTHEVRLAASDYDSNPVGFEKKEAKGLGGRLKLEKDLQKQDSEIQKGRYYSQVMTKNILTNKRHDNIKANFNTVHKIIDEDTGQQTGTYTYDDQTKDLMKQAMNRSKKTEPRFKQRDMIFDVNHKDKSNREGKD